MITENEEEEKMLIKKTYEAKGVKITNMDKFYYFVDKRYREKIKAVIVLMIIVFFMGVIVTMLLIKMETMTFV